MSTTAKIFFVASCLTTATIIYKVHSYQIEEQVRMRSGVLRDIERKIEKAAAQDNKLNNLEMMKAQVELEKKLNIKD